MIDGIEKHNGWLNVEFQGRMLFQGAVMLISNQ